MINHLTPAGKNIRQRLLTALVCLSGLTVSAQEQLSVEIIAVSIDTSILIR